MLTTTLRLKIDALWDKFWSGGIANPLTAMEQISYLLFMRRLDATDRKRQEDAEWLKQSYTSIFDGAYTAPDGKGYDKSELRWSHFRHLPGEEMLTHVRDRVFPFIKNLGGEDQAFSQYMQDAVFIIPKASLLVEAIGIIDDIYTEIQRERLDNGQTFHDTQGDLYEYLLSEISTAGKNGQFRTPRHIIQMICALVDPKLGEEVCDPACGTGGFLLGAYQNILTQHTSKNRVKKDVNGFKRGTFGDKLTNEKLWVQLKEKTFHGYDFDTTMVRIGLMNLLLHGISQPNIDYKDTLSKDYNEDNKYNVILANPPFKGSIDKGDINENLKIPTNKSSVLDPREGSRLNISSMFPASFLAGTITETEGRSFNWDVGDVGCGRATTKLVRANHLNGIRFTRYRLASFVSSGKLTGHKIKGRWLMISKPARSSRFIMSWGENQFCSSRLAPSPRCFTADNGIRHRLL